MDDPVLHLDGIIFRLQRRGGITTYFQKLIAFLEHRCNNFTINPDYRKSRNRIIDPISRYLACSNVKANGVYHSSYYRVPSDNRVPVVTTIHDCIYEKYGDGIKRKIHVWQKQKAIKRSQSIICNSHSTKNDVLEYYPEAYKIPIHIIPMGVDDSFMQVEKYNKITKNIILYIGGRGGYKNFKNAVIAVSMLGGFSLLAIGGGELTSYEKKLVNAYLPRRFKHLIDVSDTDLNIYYNMAYCLLYSSVYEGFGIPILEAMRAGCPVVGVESSSIPEVTGGAAILVECGQPEALAEGISRISGMEKKIIVERGLANASQYSWDNTFNLHLEVYAALGWAPKRFEY